MATPEHDDAVRESCRSVVADLRELAEFCRQMSSTGSMPSPDRREAMGDSGLNAAGQTIGAVLAFLVKVGLGTVVAVAVARAMGVPI